MPEHGVHLLDGQEGLPPLLGKGRPLPITALRVAAVVVFASDLERSRVFYEELLGLQLMDRTSDPHDPHWGGYAQRIYFALQHRPSEKKTEQSVAFSLEVEEVEVMVAKLRCAGVRIAIPPSKRSYGSIAGVVDPDGNLVYLYQSPPTVQLPPSASPASLTPPLRT
ncbi:MAG: VOC family protein [Planctomycetes bacterium]|nr:VOC family protein [Planctomycetota bacterium]